MLTNTADEIERKVYLPNYRLRSAFECHVTQRKYEQMLANILPLIDEDEDLLRVYKLAGNTEVQVWGTIPETFDEDVIII